MPASFIGRTACLLGASARAFGGGSRRLRDNTELLCRNTGALGGSASPLGVASAILGKLTVMLAGAAGSLGRRYASWSLCHARPPSLHYGPHVSRRRGRLKAQSRTVTDEAVSKKGFGTPVTTRQLIASGLSSVALGDDLPALLDELATWLASAAAAEASTNGGR